MRSCAHHVFWLCAGIAVLLSGVLHGCCPCSDRTSTSPRSRDRGAARRTTAAPVSGYQLSLDVRRSDGCSQTFVSTRTRGRVTVVVSRFGVSELTVEMIARQRSGPTRRPNSGVERTTRRRWQRVYRWTGMAGFMGSSVQLHLKPVGTGCTHRTIAGIKGAGCRGVVPGVVVECNPGRLADAPRHIQLRKPRSGARAPTPTTSKRRPYLTCRVEVSGRRDRVRLPHDLSFLARRLLLSPNGRPELVLNLFGDTNQVEGELQRPRAR